MREMAIGYLNILFRRRHSKPYHWMLSLDWIRICTIKPVTLPRAMRLVLLLPLLPLTVSTFCPERATRPATALSHSKGFAAFGVGAAIMASSFAAPPAVPPADAVEISSGAFSVHAYTGGGETLKSASLDGTTLFKTLLKNRKALSQSFERVQNVVKEELNSPVWTDIKKDVLQIEGDITSDIKISAPADWTQTFKDASQGKLNFILNGEIVNVAIDSELGKDGADKVLISVEGVKGVDLRGFASASPLDGLTGVYTRRWQERSNFVSDLWNTPVTQLGDFSLTAGPAVAGGLTFAVFGSYAAAYAYYSSEQEKAAKEAEEKRAAIAAKKAAAAAKKKEAEE